MILKVKDGNAKIEFKPRTLIIAGFTGKDLKSAGDHLKELAEMGIKIPDQIPTFYPAEVALVTHSDTIEVKSSQSSGEAEPVLISTGGRMYVAVGSDHTARDLERISILESKKACSKPISSEVFELDFVLENWDSLVLKSYVEKDGSMIPYQDGQASSLLGIDQIIEKLKSWDNRVKLDESVMFLGTVPLLTGSFVYGSRYRVELIETKSGKKLSCEYGVKVKGGR